MAEVVLMKGNEALAESAIRAGCHHFFGYPITPQTEINAYMADNLPRVGGTYLQAESEIAAANMVLGAASAGVRCMTSSSSPGISLKTEAISYLAGCDLPCLIVNVQRGGPGLGGIQPAQSDYWQATRAPGHGDFHILVLAPSNVQEMADLVPLAFQLAEEYRLPAMILADGALGQMMEPVTFHEGSAQKVGDFITDGHQNRRPPRVINSLHLVPDELEATVLARFARYAELEERHATAEAYMTEDADIIICAYGVAARIARGAVDMAREKGIRAGLLRPITLWPFPKRELLALAQPGRKILVAELSMGQMVDDVRLATEFRVPVRFLGRTGGMIFTTEDIVARVEALDKEALA